MEKMLKVISWVEVVLGGWLLWEVCHQKIFINLLEG